MTTTIHIRTLTALTLLGAGLGMVVLDTQRAWAAESASHRVMEVSGLKMEVDVVQQGGATLVAPEYGAHEDADASKHVYFKLHFGR